MNFISFFWSRSHWNINGQTQALRATCRKCSTVKVFNGIMSIEAFSISYIGIVKIACIVRASKGSTQPKALTASWASSSIPLNESSFICTCSQQLVLSISWSAFSENIKEVLDSSLFISSYDIILDTFINIIEDMETFAE